MEEIRSRMPDGVAPEEIPGGKAREREMRALERRIEEIGPTNALADSECRELEERFETLRTQLDDIASARGDLEQLISKLREEEESRYEAVFGAVAANFHEYFSQLAPGGRATLKHAEGDDGPRSGVEILVQPPRKRLQNVTLLSSGERALAALALVLALDEVNPSPFTILDEVDAALDDANVGRFGEMIARLGAQRQFLVITHNHVTMSHASTLYGIHLDESGSSHLVSVRLEDIRTTNARSANTAHASYRISGREHLEPRRRAHSQCPGGRAAVAQTAARAGLLRRARGDFSRRRPRPCDGGAPHRRRAGPSTADARSEERRV